ncbi:MAG TPA: hypothetical protein VK425_09520 [Acidimicrobiales bacterium]|nr:hypothetical protein [Acidimicrobiales bacterium]
MANTQWLDRSQPQTLYLSNVLLYVNAVLWVLYLSFLAILAIPALLAGLGIANEKKAGYWGGVVVAGLNVLVLADWFVQSHGQSIFLVMNMVFGIALLALLLHPMSRSYQRIWFRSISRR